MAPKKSQKQKAQPNGTPGTATPQREPEKMESLPPAVVGINFGNTFSSIAVLMEGIAECIANEEGERQIASAISFHGEETYLGNHALPQLVKNSKNTITNFRDLLGKKFSEISKTERQTSAPVVQHPTSPDEPAYIVEVLQPAPTPLPPASVASSAAPSAVATPRSEPTLTTRTLTVSEVNTLFLKSLLQSAAEFIGRTPAYAVLTVPPFFNEAQRQALKQAAEAAGVQVLQLIEETAAVAVATATDPPGGLKADRTQLIVDLGASTLSIALVALRDGLATPLASSTSKNIHGSALSDALISFFVKDFTKKTKIPLSFPPKEPADERAEAKMRLAVAYTLKTLSAGPGVATCAVESLKDGYDYTGSISGMRFDMLASPTYTAVADACAEMLKSAGVDAIQIDEVVYIGGSASLPSLDNALQIQLGLSETIVTPHSLGTVAGGGEGDPTTILARGAVVQAAYLLRIEDKQLKSAAVASSTVPALAKTIGVLFPGSESEDEEQNKIGGVWVDIILKDTPLPARRIVAFTADLGGAENCRVAFEVHEAEEHIEIEKVKSPKVVHSDDEEDEGDEEEEEFEEVKHKEVRKTGYLGAVELTAKSAEEDGGGWQTSIQVQFLVDVKGKLEVSAWEVTDDGKEEVATLTVGA